MADQFADNSRRLRVRDIAVQGAVSGLFLSQALAWQEFANVAFVRIVGAATDDPLNAFARAMLSTAYSIGLVYLITRCCVTV